GESAAARNAGTAVCRRILLHERLLALGARLVDRRAANVLRVRYAHVHVASQPERLDHAPAQEIPIVDAGQRLDQYRAGRMRRSWVVLQARSRGPFEREVAHLLAQARMVAPALEARAGARKAAA